MASRHNHRPVIQYPVPIGPSLNTVLAPRHNHRPVIQPSLLKCGMWSNDAWANLLRVTPVLFIYCFRKIWGIWQNLSKQYFAIGITFTTVEIYKKYDDYHMHLCILNLTQRVKINERKKWITNIRNKCYDIWLFWTPIKGIKLKMASIIFSIHAVFQMQDSHIEYTFRHFFCIHIA